MTEGNYLLLWSSVRDLLDEVWFLAPDEQDRLRRLVQRHRAFGRSLAQARERAHGSDQSNADLVNATVAIADLVIARIR